MSKPDPKHFAFMLPPSKTWFSPKEVAAIIGKSDQYVRDCFDNQKIMGHQLNGRIRQGSEKRRTYQIHRDCLMLYLLETANYEPSDYMQRVFELIANCPAEALVQFRDSINIHLKRKHGSREGVIDGGGYV